MSRDLVYMRPQSYCTKRMYFPQVLQELSHIIMS